MIHISIPILIEFIFGLFLWWVGVYLITQNPLSRLIQIVFGILLSVSFYFSSDIFFYAAHISQRSDVLIFSIKSIAWTMYLPVALLYHLSFILIAEEQRKIWQKVLLFLGYLLAGILIFLETWTNLTRNYSLAYSQNFNGDITQLKGQYFWIIGIFFISFFTATFINLYQLLKKQIRFSKNWYKFFWPLIGLSVSVILGPFVLLSYYNIIPYPILLADLIFGSISISFIYSIIKCDLFIDEAKIIFGKTFLYSTMGIFIVLMIYAAALFTQKSTYWSLNSMVFTYILTYLVIASHPAYSWLTTLARDLVYNISSGFSVVNDDEIYYSLRNYNNPERLQECSLLRLNIISHEIKNNENNTVVDALRKTIKETVNYFKPENNSKRRTKQNLKYHLLKMLTFDQAEEGQILWELGFREYPVRIMMKEPELRPPLFKTASPSDYIYASRNAYIALKKEAIHDVAARISYLEKLSKKKIS